MKDVRVLEDRITYGEAEVIKVKAIHGTKVPCGDACGYVFRSPNERLSMWPVTRYGAMRWRRRLPCTTRM